MLVLPVKAPVRQGIGRREAQVLPESAVVTCKFQVAAQGRLPVTLTAEIGPPESFFKQNTGTDFTGHIGNSVEAQFHIPQKGSGG